MSYEGFEEWKDRYISSHKEQGLTGYCWDFIESGQCFDMSQCPYKHEYPRARINNRDNVNTNSKAANQSNMTLGFGKHCNKKLHEIPIDYILWIKKNDVLDGKSSELKQEMLRVWPDIFKEKLVSVKKQTNAADNNQQTNTGRQMRMQFGKHRGKLLHELPSSYIQWMKRNNVLDDKEQSFVDEIKKLFPHIFE